MSVADLTLAAYAFLTVVSIFAAGRLWGQGQAIEPPRRWLATLFAVAEVVVLAYYVSWTDDRFHRASYMMMNTAVGAVVACGWGLVVFTSRRRRGGWFLVHAVVLGVLAMVAAGITVAMRTQFWPPFAFLALCLVLAPALAVLPRVTVPGYRLRREPDLVAWVLLGLCGILAVVETVPMVGLVPGTAWYGRPGLLHFFLAGAVVTTILPGRARPPSPTPETEAVPWHRFNPPLSPREADLVPGLRRRLTNKELAAELGVSESTVKKHVVSIFRKAGVETRQALVERLDSPNS